VLICAWSYSNYPFARAMPTERTEAILAGMVSAFTFFDCVPHEVWWDNPKTVVSRIFKGRERKANERYAALASHYAFDPLFCMPARGNEKPCAETHVRVLQRQWATPVPRVDHLDGLNAHLRACCLKEADRTVPGYQEPIGRRFGRDRANALALPAQPFDACITVAACVDKYQTVRFDNNSYSVPRSCAFRTVTVKGYVERVEVVAGAGVVARHDRCYGKDEQVLDPLHYLAAPGRRPAALDHAPVLKGWRLPESFARLRQALETRHGPKPGARQYIRVLQLLADHPLERVQKAVEDGLKQGATQAERIIASVSRLAEKAGPSPAAAEVTQGCQPGEVSLDRYQVPRPDLGRFDQLLNNGERDDERE
jgi:hypothetical protein